MIASLHASACDISDFGAPPQALPPPWLSSRGCKPSRFLSCSQELGLPLTRAGDTSAKPTKSQWHNGSHPSTPHQSSRSITHNIPAEPAPAQTPQRGQRPLQGRLRGFGSCLTSPPCPETSRHALAQHPWEPHSSRVTQTPQTTPNSRQRMGPHGAMRDGDETTAIRRAHQEFQRLWRRRGGQQEVVRDGFVVAVRGQRPPLPHCINISACSAISQLKCNYLPNTHLYITPLLLSSRIFSAVPCQITLIFPHLFQHITICLQSLPIR